MWSNSSISYLELALPSKFKIFGQFGPGFWHFDVRGMVSMIHLYGYGVKLPPLTSVTNTYGIK